MHEKKSALVTGATGEIGKAIVKLLAKNSFRVTMAVRNVAKAQATRKDILHEYPNSDIEIAELDVSSQESIRKFAGDWKNPLDILINNAAATPLKREETSQGIEMQWATNVLGYFWMMNHLKENLKHSGHGKIVNVASYWAGDLDLDDPEFNRRSYNNNTAYRQSKQANRMLSAGFAEIFSREGIQVNSCHPGDVNSPLSNNLGFGGHQSPEDGAETPVWIATRPYNPDDTGKFYERKQEVRDPFSQDKELINRLIAICESY
jgi:NAD(P)-dependent dehydrogenase (short-subunit alcohol dehydrogenase family)